MFRIFFLSMFWLSVASGAQAQAVSESSAAAVPEYRIGPQDLLFVDVFQVDDFSRKVRVSATGRISLPLIGEIQAAGRTARELEGHLAARLGEKYLRDPQVSVFIEEYTSQRVTVEGQVNRPGVFALKGRTTLLQAVAMAEGVDDTVADPERVQVFRARDDGTRHTLVYDLEAIRAGKQADPVIEGDDIVVVPKAGVKAAVKGLADALRGFIQFNGQL